MWEVCLKLKIPDEYNNEHNTFAATYKHTIYIYMYYIYIYIYIIYICAYVFHYQVKLKIEKLKAVAKR